jgi:hypothetical protein
MRSLEACARSATEKALEFEMAYQSRVAMDRIRFAIKQTECENLNAGMLQEIGLQLLDALERLETAERHFQVRSGHDFATFDTSSSPGAPVSNGSRRSRHQDR